MTEQIELSLLSKFMRNKVQHFNPIKYWRYRNKVIYGYESANWLKKIVLYYYLYYIKKTDAFNNASLGTHLGFGAEIEEPPYFPHGLYGIIISHRAKIGKNCTVFHQVTIGEGGGWSP